ncbi:hypothetical protein EGR_06584 [Echinococcus granulosus]|uniref:Uncharacterized protein n=1 Tax=Echinococcus granulosus TaxID=6210 RepID=W6UKH1_ECHGR|nr:hypothetical protein EGR_06584 [Echinococcus granulosus]EUB58597.1 hypothetical protein EGR_06584 [Echinococcus granulosus]
MYLAVWAGPLGHANSSDTFSAEVRGRRINIA